MKRFAISLICPLIVGICFTSCLPEAEETELTSTVALLSFGINDLKTEHTITLDNGKDSTYTSVMKGNAVKFTIDHEGGLVYNTSPIAYGTDITRVTTSLSADGYVHYIHPTTKEKTGYNSEDTINFTQPVKFTITSYDERFSRDYLIRINVYQSDPNATQWQQLEAATFPASLFTEQKAVIRDTQLYVFGKDTEGKAYTTATDLSDGTQWSAPAEWIGIGYFTERLSVILHQQDFYTLANGQLYRSANGTDWEPINTTTSLTALIGTTTEASPAVWGISDNQFVSTTDLIEWQANEQRLTQQLEGNISCISQPLRTNANIHRTIFISNAAITDTCAHVWSKLSSETKWTKVEPVGQNPYGCPNLQDLAVINYRNRLYAFGGMSLGNRKAPIEPFSTCYESRDNGVTWRIRERSFSLHESFIGRNEPFATAVDAQGYVWMIWGTSGEVWKGIWNKTN